MHCSRVKKSRHLPLSWRFWCHANFFAISRVPAWNTLHLQVLCKNACPYFQDVLCIKKMHKFLRLRTKSFIRWDILSWEVSTRISSAPFMHKIAYECRRWKLFRCIWCPILTAHRINRKKSFQENPSARVSHFLVQRSSAKQLRLVRRAPSIVVLRLQGRTPWITLHVCRYRVENV